MFVSDSYLVSYPGYKKKVAARAAGRGRGLFHSTRSDVLVEVIGSKVFVIDGVFGTTEVPGSLASQTGEIYMDENLNSQVCIVDGINAYILTLKQPYTLNIQTDGPLSDGTLIPNYVRFHDTFFLIGNGNLTSAGSRWYAYSFNKGPPDQPVITPASLIAVTTELFLQTKPDFALAVIPIPSASNSVLVMGKTVCEIQQNIGGVKNYIRNQSINVDFGCLSVATIASSDKHVVWLGSNADNGPTIMVFQGNQATTLSTDGINNMMANIKFPDQSTAFFHRVAGHLIYQITFFNTADNISLAYDFDTQLFCHVTDQFQGCHPAMNVVYFKLKNYFQSFKDGSLYEMGLNISYIDENIAKNALDPDYNTDLLWTIPRMRIVNDVSQGDSGRFRSNSFVLPIVQGNDPAFSELDLLARWPNLIVTEDNFNPPNEPIITENGDYVIAEQLNTTPPTPGAGELAQYLPPVAVGYRPRVDCNYSIDDGVVFGNIVSRPLNPVGRRKNILTFGNMGACNILTIKLQFHGLAQFIVSNGQVQAY